MNRRNFFRGGAGLAAALTVGCSKAETGRKESALADYEMPLESAPHERTFMQWPVSVDVYGRADLARVQSSIARVANTIAQYEPVVMLVGAEHISTVRRKLSAEIEIWDIPTDDLWCRDSGPTFVRNAAGDLVISHIRFNGWGDKQPHENDGLIAQRVAQRLNLPLIDSGLIGEQGGVEHDGAGTLLAHASCWVNPNRNSISQAQIEQRLLRALGGKHMIWAPGIKGADITDFHIDALARFVSPGELLIQLGDKLDHDDPWSVAGHETLRLLEQATDVQGNKLEIIRLPDPINIRSRQPDFVASYVNYYVCNDAVIAPQFGDRNADRRARTLLESLYPNRTIEMLNIDAIGASGGGIHCATQQQPKVG